jgi:hypothetical protein
MNKRVWFAFHLNLDELAVPILCFEGFQNMNLSNKDFESAFDYYKSATSVCHKVAAWVPDIFLLLFSEKSQNCQ